MAEVMEVMKNGNWANLVSLVMGSWITSNRCRFLVMLTTVTCFNLLDLKVCYDRIHELGV